MTRAEQLAHSNTVHGTHQSSYWLGLNSCITFFFRSTAGEGDFVCHLCGKKMKTIMSLENHIKLHSKKIKL